jgi:adenine-specific DNA-methyltransferase
MVTIVTNTAGSTSPGLFSRAEEYAFFCFFGAAKPAPMETDLLADSKPTTQFWFPLFRSRGLNDRPSRRPNLVYPIAIDPQSLTICGTGRSLKERVEAGEVSGDLDAWLPDPSEDLDGKAVVWPILHTGEMSTWQVGSTALPKLVEEGFVRVRAPKSPGGPRPFTIAYVKAGNRKKVKAGQVAVLGREPGGALILEGGQRSTIPKSTWKVPSHDARLYGTTMLRSLLGSTSFTYPKSPYAVMDTLRTVLADNREGLVLDFFAGSGTTLQAVAMLNRSDEGRRRVILVTNNELDEETAAALIADGHAPGDDQYEAHGICRAITAPRVRAALTGRGPDGRPLDGTYLDGSDLAGGFDENAVFFDLAYDDPDRIEIGQRLSDILPTLWLAAGAVGSPDDLAPGERWVMPAGTRFAVLLDEDAFRGFLALVKGCPRLTHAWLVTDSESAFARMRERLPKHLKTGMLYRDYLRNFRVNVEV